jgi:hypothetical protein
VNCIRIKFLSFNQLFSFFFVSQWIRGIWAPNFLIFFAKFYLIVSEIVSMAIDWSVFKRFWLTVKKSSFLNCSIIASSRDYPFSIEWIRKEPSKQVGFKASRIHKLFGSACFIFIRNQFSQKLLWSVNTKNLKIPQNFNGFSKICQKVWIVASWFQEFGFHFGAICAATH